MTELELLREAIQDIERVLASLAQLGKMSKDDALKTYEDSCVTIAQICTAVQSGRHS